MINTKQNNQCRLCRRAGEKLFLKGDRCNSPKCAMVKRPTPPGVHGSQRPKKLTSFGQQLMEKQKAKREYGLREKQFKGYFFKALKKVGNTNEWLFRYLETRLDNTVYRLNFVDSRKKARQLVNHGHFLVNGSKVNIPSYQVKVGDIITIREKSLQSPVFKELSQTLKNKETNVSWAVIDADKLEGKITGSPTLADASSSVDWRVIIQFYSK